MNSSKKRKLIMVLGIFIALIPLSIFLLINITKNQNDNFVEYEEVLVPEEQMMFEFSDDFSAKFVGFNKPGSEVTGNKFVLPTYVMHKPGNNLPEIPYFVNEVDSKGAFDGTSITEINVDNGSLSQIGEGSFSGAKYLKKITLPFVGSQVATLGVTNSASMFGYVFGYEGNKGNGDLEFFYRAEGKNNPDDPSCPVTGNSGVTGNPAFCLPKSLKNVVITEDTIIEKYAFEKCAYLETVEFKTAGSARYTFLGTTFSLCTSLKSVVLPKNVVSPNLDNEDDGAYMFQYCYSLESVVFPENLEVLRKSTFLKCYSLKSVSLPGDLKIIEDYVFKDCRVLTDILTNQEAGWPRFLEKIGEEAFRDCFGLTSVTLPASMKEIGYAAFNGCYNLETMTLPFVGRAKGDNKSNATLKEDSRKSNPVEYNFFGYIFGSEEYTSGTTTSYKTSYTLGSNGLTYSYCLPKSLKNVVINGEEFVATGAFGGCYGINTVTINSSVQTIEKAAFSGAYGIEDITLPFIGSSADAKEVGSVFGYIFGDTKYPNSELVEQSYRSTEGDLIKTYNYVPSSLTTIKIMNQNVLKEYSLANLDMVKNIIIEDTLSMIEESALFGCSNLVTLSIPFAGKTAGDYEEYNTTNYAEKSLGYIFGKKYFNNSIEQRVYYHQYISTNYYTVYYVPQSLIQVTLNGGYNVSKYSLNFMENLERVIVSDSATSISTGFLAGCSSLKTLTVPYIGKYNNIESNNSSSATPVLGHFFGRNAYPNSTSVTQYSKYTGNVAYYIPSSLEIVNVTTATSINSYTFQNAKMLTLVEYYQNISSIGSYAFAGANNLKTFVIPKDSTFTTIPEYAFQNCNLNSIEFLPASVKSISAYAFYGNGIVNLDLTNMITVGDYAFASNIKMSSLTVTNSLENIGKYVFYSNLSLKDVNYAANKLGESMFMGCTGLEEISLPNVVGIARYAFNGCSSLTTVNINPSATIIDSYAFANCSSLEYILLPDELITINNYAFNNCLKLKSIIIPKKVQNLDSRIFEGCNSSFVIYVYLYEDQRPGTWRSDFNYCSKLRYYFPIIILGDGLSDFLIFEYDFTQGGYYVIGVQEGVVLPDVISIPDRHFSAPVYGIKDRVFQGHPNITQVMIGGNLRSIGEQCFSNENPTIVYSQSSSTSGKDYIGKEESWLIKGKVYYQEVWKYAADGSIYLIPEMFTYQFNQMVFSYTGSAFTPNLVGITETCVCVGGMEKEVFDSTGYHLAYYDNVNASDSNYYWWKYYQPRVEIYKVENGKNVYVTTRNFTINRAVVTIKYSKEQFTTDGRVYNDDWNEGQNYHFTQDLNGLGYTMSGWVSSYRYGWVTAGAYIRQGTYNPGYYNSFYDYWSNVAVGLTVYNRAGVNVSRNFSFVHDIRLYINKAPAKAEWTNTDIEESTNYYLYQYTGKAINPKATLSVNGARLDVAYYTTEGIQIPAENLVTPGDTVYKAVATIPSETHNNTTYELENHTIFFKIVPAKLSIRIENNKFIIDPTSAFWSCEDLKNSKDIQITGLASNHTIKGTLRSSGFEKGDYVWRGTGYDGGEKYLYWVEGIYTDQETGEELYFTIVDNSGADVREYYQIDSVEGDQITRLGALEIAGYIKIDYPEIEYRVLLDGNEITLKNETINGIGIKTATVYYDGQEHQINIEATNAKAAHFSFQAAGGGIVTMPYTFGGVGYYGHHVINFTGTADRYNTLTETIAIRVIKRTLVVDYSKLNREYNGSSIVEADILYDLVDDKMPAVYYHEFYNANRESISMDKVKNAGTYYIRTIVEADDYFYESDTGLVQFTIEKRSLEIDIQGSHHFVEDMTKVWHPTSLNLVNGDVFVGILETNGYKPGIYKDLENDFRWINEEGKWLVRSYDSQDISYNYKVVLLGEYEIIPLEFENPQEIGAFNDVYDDAWHTAEFTVDNPPLGTLIEYSINQSNWTTTKFSFKAVSNNTVYYRATCENYRTLTGTIVINILNFSKANMGFDAVLIKNYTGEGLSPEISIQRPANAEIYYSITELSETDSGWSLIPPAFVEIGEYVFYILIKVGETTVLLESLVFNVLPKTIQTNDFSVFNPIVYYDGKEHSISVMINNEELISDGYAIYYSTEDVFGVNFTPNPEYLNKPTFVDSGEHTIYFVIYSPHYQLYFGNGIVTILDRELSQMEVEIEVPPAKTYDRLPSTVKITVTNPEGGYTIWTSVPDYEVKPGDVTKTDENGILWVKGILSFVDAGRYLLNILIECEGYHSFRQHELIIIDKAHDDVSIDTSDIEYTGLPFDDELVKTKLGHDGNRIYEFYKLDESSNIFVPMETSPTELGTYKVFVILEESNNFYRATAEGEFRIVPKNLDIYTVMQKEYEYTSSDIVTFILSGLQFVLPENSEIIIDTLDLNFSGLEFYNPEKSTWETAKEAVELGTYRISVELTGQNPNYILEPGPYEFKIVPRKIIISGTYEKEYDGNVFSYQSKNYPNYDYNLLEGHILSLTYETNDNGIGSYTIGSLILTDYIIMTGDGSYINKKTNKLWIDYYEIVVKDFVLAITLRKIHYTIGQTEFTYDGYEHEVKVTTSNLQYDGPNAGQALESFVITYDYENQYRLGSFKRTDAGTYTINIRISKNFYKEEYIEVDFIIHPYQIELKLDTYSKEYDTEQFNAIYSVVKDELSGFNPHGVAMTYYKYIGKTPLNIPVEDITIEMLENETLFSVTSPIDAGTYYLLIDGDCGTNFILENIFEITITPAPLYLKYKMGEIIKFYDGMGYFLSLNSAEISGLFPTHKILSGSIITISGELGWYIEEDDFIFNEDVQIISMQNEDMTDVTHNYTPIVSGLRVHIQKQSMDHVKVIDNEKIYDGNPFEVVIYGNDSDGLVHEIYFVLDDDNQRIEDSKDPTGYKTVSEMINVGKYQVYVDIDEGTHHEALKNPITAIYEITQREIEVEWSVEEYQRLWYTANTLIPEAFYELNGKKHVFNVVVLTGGDGIELGHYVVEAVDESGNFIISNAYRNFYIVEIEIHVEIDEERRYDGETPWTKELSNEDFEQVLSIHKFQLHLETKYYRTGTYVNENDQYSDDFIMNYSLTMNDDNNIDVSKYYRVYYSLRVTIFQPDVQLSVPEVVEYTYTGNSYGPSVTVLSPKPNSGTIADIKYSSFPGGPYSSELSQFEKRDVGEYIIYIQGNADYYNTTTTQTKIIIKKANPVIILNELTRTYNPLIVTNDAFIRSSISGMSFYDREGALEITIRDANGDVIEGATDVGSYTVQICISDSNNFFAYDEFFTFEILPIELNLSFNEVLVWTASTEGEHWSFSNEYYSSNITALLNNHKLIFSISTPDKETFGPNFKNLMRKTYYSSENDFLSDWTVVHATQGTDYTSCYQVNIDAEVTIRYANITPEDIVVLPDNVEYDGNAHSVIINSRPDFVYQITYGVKEGEYGLSQSEVEKIMPETYIIYYKITSEYREDYYGNVVLIISKITRGISTSLDSLDKEYDATAVVIPEIVFTGYVDDNAIAKTELYNLAFSGNVISQALNAGNYRLVILADETEYYQEFRKEVNFTISLRTVTISGTVEKQYNTGVWINSNWTNPSGLEVTGLLEGHTIKGNLVTRNADVGIYTGSNIDGRAVEWQNHAWTIRDGRNVYQNSNFKVDISGVTVEIKKAQISYKLTNLQYEYTGSPHTFNLEVITPSSGYKLSFSTNNGATWDAEQPYFTALGRHPFLIKITHDNFETKEIKGEFNIVEASVVVNGLDTFSKVYDSLRVNPKLTISSNVEPQFIYYEFDKEKEEWLLMGEGDYPINAGKYKVNIFIGATAYTNALVIQDHEFEITPATLSFSWEGSEFVYNGLKQVPKVLFTAQGLDYLVPTLTITKGDSDSINASDAAYEIKASLNNRNYNVVEASTTHKYYIKPRTVYIQVNIPSFIYKENTPWSANLLHSDYVKNLVSNSLVNHQMIGTISTKDSSVGIYDNLSQFNLIYVIKDSKTDNDVTSNYNLQTSLNVVIQDSEIGFECPNKVVTYDGGKHTINLIVSSGITDYTITYSDSLHGKYSEDMIYYSDANEAGYTIYFRITKDNYSTKTGSGKLYIMKGTAEITDISNLDKEYDTEAVSNPTFTYIGDNPRPNTSITYYNKEDIKIPAPTNVGNYKVVISVAAGKNYNAIEVSKTFTISKISLTIKLTNGYKIWNGSVWMQDLTIGNDWSRDPATNIYTSPNGNIVISGLLEGHDFSAVIQTTFADARKYDGDLLEDFIFFNYDLDNPESGYIIRDRNNFNSNVQENYQVIIDFNVDIWPASMKVTCDPIITMYDGTPKHLTVKVDGEPGQQAVTIMFSYDGQTWMTSDEYYLSDNATLASSTPYQIWYNVSCPNYESITTSQTITIQHVNGTIHEISDISKMYDRSPVNDPTVLTLSTGKITFSYFDIADTFLQNPISAPTNVGKYIVKVHIEKDGQYAEITQNQTFEIHKRIVDVQWEDTITKPIIYNGHLQLPEAIINNPLGEVVDFEISLQDSSGLNGIIVGEYWAILTSNNGNYEVRNNLYQYSIHKQQISLPITYLKFMYDGFEHEFIQFSDFYSVKNGSGIDAGEYNVIVSLLDKHNYEWENETIDDLNYTANIIARVIDTDDGNINDDEFEDLISGTIKVTGIDKSYSYTGTQITPNPSVTFVSTDSDFMLSLKIIEDYTVTYGINIQDSGQVTITGVGNYQFEIIVTFEIVSGVLQLIDENTTFKFIRMEYVDFDSSYDFTTQEVERDIYDPVHMDLLVNIESDVPISFILSQFKNPLNQLRVYDQDDILIDAADYESTFMASNYTIALFDVTGLNLIDKIKVSVVGELTSSQEVDALDAMRLLNINALLVLLEKEDYALIYASDTTGDGIVDALDAMRLMNHNAMFVDIYEEYRIYNI